MTSLNQINLFLNSGTLAMAGVSRNPRKFGHAAFLELRNKGMDILPVNPVAETISGVRAYPTVSALPSEVKGLIIMTRKDNTASVVKEALDAGIKQFWLQQMSDSKQAVDMLSAADGVNFITGECILMHYKPKGFHKFHKALNKLFGRFPR